MIEYEAPNQKNKGQILETKQKATLAVGDELSIQDSFVTWIRCEGEYVGFVSWSWSATLTVGQDENQTVFKPEPGAPVYRGKGEGGFADAETVRKGLIGE